MDPTHLGPYRIVGRLGRGGMGTVYEAIDGTSGLSVAVKVLAAHLAEEPALRRRFLSEIETLKELVHPAIVRLLAYGEEEGQPYFAMELVRGTSLDQRLRGGERFEWRRCAEIAITVTRALKVAHDHGVIHRDLKPANLLVTEEGGVKLADFGIAKLFGVGGFTAHGSVVGTAEYMAPEQAKGEPLDHRADLYALGGVMFSMLTGRPPLKGRSIPEILDKLLREQPPRVASLVPDVPHELDELIDRMLSKDPARRPPTALVTGRLLEAIIEASQAPAVGDAHEPSPGGGHGTLPGSGSVTAERATASDGRAGRSPVDEPPAVTRDAVSVGGQNRAPPRGNERSGNSQDTAATVAFTGDASPVGPEVELHLTTRFTTVENLEKVKAEQAAREARRQAFFGAATAILLVTAVAAGGYLLLRPPSADELHSRIISASRDADDLRDAAPLVERFLVEHPDDPRAGEVRLIAERIAVESLDRRTRSSRRERLSPLDRDYRLAIERADESPSLAIVMLEAIQTLHSLHPPAGREASTEGDGPSSPHVSNDADWSTLLDSQIARLSPLAEAERADDLARIAAALAEADRLTRQSERNPVGSAEALAQRRRILAAITTLYEHIPHAAAAVAEARRLLHVATPTTESPTGTESPTAGAAP